VLAGTDAVTLFCERAGEAKIGFQLEPGNASLVAAICARLEGIPLALELAAARVRTLPLAEIAARLDHSLDLLSKGPRGAAQRQNSLRGAISWSHELLGGTERVLFRRLAVFVGGFNLEAAEHICAGNGLEAADVVDLLESLVDKSLVALGAERAGKERYRMLETIRAFGTERLEEAGEADLLRTRHAGFFGDLALVSAESGNPPSSLDRLEEDHPNLLAESPAKSERRPPARGLLGR
jgi:predicted ATPase